MLVPAELAWERAQGLAPKQCPASKPLLSWKLPPSLLQTKALAGRWGRLSSSGDSLQGSIPGAWQTGTNARSLLPEKCWEALTADAGILAGLPAL